MQSNSLFLKFKKNYDKKLEKSFRDIDEDIVNNVDYRSFMDK
jgi:hypothetical protein